LKFFRKVYKDCLLSFNGNRYYVPVHVVGKKILLKVKGSVVRIYHDDELLGTHSVPANKGCIVGTSPFNPRILGSGQRLQPKYSKGKATRGLVSKTLFPEVGTRSLAEYEEYAAGGGALWRN